MLTSIQVCRIVGITYRVLDTWARAGIVRPAVEAAGSGTQRRWRHDQLPTLHALARLARLGADHEVLRPIGRWLADYPLGCWTDPIYVNVEGLVVGPEAPGAYYLDLASCVDADLPLSLAV